MESKLKSREAEMLNRKLGFKNAVWIDCRVEGCQRAGDLVLLWAEEVEISLLSLSQNHIVMEVTDVCEGNAWRFIGFYGHPEENKKHLS